MMVHVVIKHASGKIITLVELILIQLPTYIKPWKAINRKYMRLRSKALKLPFGFYDR